MMWKFIFINLSQLNIVFTLKFSFFLPVVHYAGDLASFTTAKSLLSDILHILNSFILALSPLFTLYPKEVQKYFTGKWLKEAIFSVRLQSRSDFKRAVIFILNSLNSYPY